MSIYLRFPFSFYSYLLQFMVFTAFIPFFFLQEIQFCFFLCKSSCSFYASAPLFTNSIPFSHLYQTFRSARLPLAVTFFSPPTKSAQSSLCNPFSLLLFCSLILFTSYLYILSLSFSRDLSLPSHGPFPVVLSSLSLHTHLPFALLLPPHLLHLFFNFPFLSVFSFCRPLSNLFLPSHGPFPVAFFSKFLHTHLPFILLLPPHLFHHFL